MATYSRSASGRDSPPAYRASSKILVRLHLSKENRNLSREIRNSNRRGEDAYDRLRRPVGTRVSWLREVMSSFRKTFRRWYVTHRSRYFI